MHELARTVFAFVCGQGPAHTWMPGGVTLPFCQRCTGLYTGAAVALVLHLALRIRPGGRFLQVHGAFLLAMVPFGYHWLPQGAVVRTVVGFVYGAGIVSFLWLLPGHVVGHVWPLTSARAAVYAGLVAAGVVAAPLSASRAGMIAADALVIAALAGLAGLVALAVANAAVGGWWLRDRLAGHPRGAKP